MVFRSVCLDLLGHGLLHSDPIVSRKQRNRQIHINRFELTVSVNGVGRHDSNILQLLVTDRYNKLLE